MLNQKGPPSKALFFRSRSARQGLSYYLMFRYDHLKKVFSMLNQGGPPSKACFSGLDLLGKASVII